MITMLAIIAAVVITAIFAVASAKKRGTDVVTTLILVKTIAIAAVAAVVSASNPL